MGRPMKPLPCEGGVAVIIKKGWDVGGREEGREGGVSRLLDERGSKARRGLVVIGGGVLPTIKRSSL